MKTTSQKGTQWLDFILLPNSKVTLYEQKFPAISSMQDSTVQAY